MNCQHDTKYKCIYCYPEGWDPPESHIKEVNARILENLVATLLIAKQNYYYPETVQEGDEPLSDVRYDMYENALKEQYPNHPLLQMVGFDESKVEECLNWRPHETI